MPLGVVALHREPDPEGHVALHVTARVPHTPTFAVTDTLELDST
jgi:hypothetical protein